MAWVPSSELEPAKEQVLRRQLTVIPRKVGDYPGDAPSPIKLFTETSTHMGIPREYYLENRKSSHEVVFEYTLGAPLPSGLAFDGELREEQQRALHALLDSFTLEDCTGGIVRAAPGWGKTVFCCSAIATLNVPTLVIVHKEFLMNQWRERVQQFLPEAEIGHVQQDVCDFEGKHVVMAMVHSLAQKNYPAALYSWPGLLITDEVHRIGAETWAPVPAKFPARWRLGVSATPRRKDGADNVFKYNIGRVFFSATEQRLKVKIKRVWTDFRLVKTPRFNPSLAPRSLILKFLVASRKRNERIAGQIVDAVKAGRKLLVLSERLQHLDDLDGFFRNRWRKENPDTEVPSVGYYVGGRTEEERAEAAKAQVIFATKQFASEGLDIPALDTLIIATPIGDVEQAVGRIQRPHPDKKEPIVVDIRDDYVKPFKIAGQVRDRFYLRVT
jgi:superfamily II DNA or RNA helicase